MLTMIPSSLDHSSSPHGGNDLRYTCQSGRDNIVTPVSIEYHLSLSVCGERDSVEEGSWGGEMLENFIQR